MTELTEDRRAHLQMIQAVIARMAGESARMKQFALLSLGALASTAAATQSPALAYVAGLLSLVFWALDARYLAQERWFRELYDEVRAETGPASFLMTPGEAIRARVPLRKAMLGWSVALLYGMLIVIAVLIAQSIDGNGDGPETDTGGKTARVEQAAGAVPA